VDGDIKDFCCVRRAARGPRRPGSTQTPVECVVIVSRCACARLAVEFTCLENDSGVSRMRVSGASDGLVCRARGLWWFVRVCVLDWSCRLSDIIILVPFEKVEHIIRRQGHMPSSRPPLLHPHRRARACQLVPVG